MLSASTPSPPPPRKAATHPAPAPASPYLASASGGRPACSRVPPQAGLPRLPVSAHPAAAVPQVGSASSPPRRREDPTRPCAGSHPGRLRRPRPWPCRLLASARRLPPDALTAACSALAGSRVGHRGRLRLACPCQVPLHRRPLTRPAAYVLLQTLSRPAARAKKREACPGQLPKPAEGNEIKKWEDG
ncbi:hypothetical protein VPH35_123375 [Triticum aestivum]